MSAPLVVVELPVEEARAREVNALLAACTEGLASGRCELTRRRSTQGASALAVVSWRSREHLSALIEVGRREGENESWRSQQLAFQPQDAPLERYRALGFAIASLFKQAQSAAPANEASAAQPSSGEARAAAAASAGSPEKPKGAPEAQKPDGTADSKKPEAREAASSARSPEATAPAEPGQTTEATPGWVALRARMDRSRGLSAWRFGGEVVGAFRPRGLPWFVSAVGGYARGSAPAGVSLGVAHVEAGPGAVLPLGHKFEARAALRAVLVAAAAQVSDSERGEDSASRWVPGGEFELELVFPARGMAALTLSAHYQRLGSKSTIFLRNQEVGGLGTDAFGLSLGLELRPFRRAP